MALGLTLGIILGVSGGTQHTKIQQSSVNEAATASATGLGHPAVSRPAGATPRPSASASVTTQARTPVPAGG
jgi:hypothetical protein